MLVIEDIKILDVDRNELELACYNPKSMYDFNVKYDREIDKEVKREWIRGGVFKIPGGKELCIGMSKQVQEVLGYPMEVLETMRGNISWYNQRWVEHREYLSLYKNMSLFKRLKFLFLGRRLNILGPKK